MINPEMRDEYIVRSRLEKLAQLEELWDFYQLFKKHITVKEEERYQQDISSDGNIILIKEKRPTLTLHLTEFATGYTNLLDKYKDKLNDKKRIN